MFRPGDEFFFFPVGNSSDKHICPYGAQFHIQLYTLVQTQPLRWPLSSTGGKWGSCALIEGASLKELRKGGAEVKLYLQVPRSKNTTQQITNLIPLLPECTTAHFTDGIFCPPHCLLLAQRPVVLCKKMVQITAKNSAYFGPRFVWYSCHSA